MTDEMMLASMELYIGAIQGDWAVYLGMWVPSSADLLGKDRGVKADLFSAVCAEFDFYGVIEEWRYCYGDETTHRGQ
jgi:hypothetical protein